MESIDKTDKDILNLLVKDSKMSLREISSKLGLKIDVAHRRIKRLQQKNVIKKYTVLPDFDALGYSQLAFIVIKLNNITKERKQDLHNYLIHRETISEVFTTFGDWDYSVTLLVKSKEELNEEINVLRERFNDIISNWQCLSVLKIDKMNEYQFK